MSCLCNGLLWNPCQRTTAGAKSPSNPSASNSNSLAVRQPHEHQQNSEARENLYQISRQNEISKASHCRDFVQALHDNLCSPTAADVELVLQLLGDSSLPPVGWKHNVRVHIDKIIGIWHKVMAGGASQGQAAAVALSDSRLQVWFGVVNF